MGRGPSRPPRDDSGAGVALSARSDGAGIPEKDRIAEFVVVLTRDEYADYLQRLRERYGHHAAPMANVNRASTSEHWGAL